MRRKSTIRSPSTSPVAFPLLNAEYHNPLGFIMSSSAFLTLTPTMQSLDSRVHVPGPIDLITFKLGSLVSGSKTAPIGNDASVNQSNSLSTDEVETPPIDELVSLPSVEKPIANPILPPLQNDKQDAVAEKGDTAADMQDAMATTPPPEFLSPATILKRRLENTKDLIVCPGVYDGFSARIALSVGFDALYMVSKIARHTLYLLAHIIQTGAGTTASRLGQPDLGLAQLSDMRAHADMIANLDPDGTPLIADMDTGYGGRLQHTS